MTDENHNFFLKRNIDNIWQIEHPFNGVKGYSVNYINVKDILHGFAEKD